MRAGTAHRLARRSGLWPLHDWCTTALMLPSPVRAGRGAHKGRAPALTGWAASAATRARARVSSRTYVL